MRRALRPLALALGLALVLPLASAEPPRPAHHTEDGFRNPGPPPAPPSARNGPCLPVHPSCNLLSVTKALEAGDDRERLKGVAQRLAVLGTDFTQNLLAPYKPNDPSLRTRDNESSTQDQ